MIRATPLVEDEAADACVRGKSGQRHVRSKRVAQSPSTVPSPGSKICAVAGSGSLSPLAQPVGRRPWTTRDPGEPTEGAAVAVRSSRLLPRDDVRRQERRTPTFTLGVQRLSSRGRIRKSNSAIRESDGAPFARVSFPSASPCRLLVVGHDDQVTESIRLILHEGGYADVHVAAAGSDALASAARFPPDIVLLDLDPQDARAYEFAGQLTTGPGPAPQIIGLFDAETCQLGDRLAGALADYIPKPIHPRVLLARVSAALRLRTVEADRLDRRNELFLLESLSHLLSSTRSLDVVLKTTVRKLIGLFGIEMAVIRLLKGDHTVWAVREDQSSPSIADDDLAVLDVGVRRLARGSLGALARGNVADVRPASRLPQRARAVARRLRVDAVIWLPLLANDEPIGVLVIGRSGCESYSERQLARLLHIAGQVAAMVERASLIADITRRIERAEKLQHLIQLVSASLDPEPILDAAAEVARVLEAGAVHIWLRESDEPQLRLVRPRHSWGTGQTLPIRGSLAGRVLRTGRPFQTDRLRRHIEQCAPAPIAPPDFQSWLGVPIRVPGGRSGVLAVLDRERRRFSADEVQVLLSLAHCVAISLGNARLYGEARSAQERARAELEFTSTITSSIGEGVVAVTREGRVTFANRAAEQMLGWGRWELIGEKIQDVAPFQRADGSYLDGQNHPTFPVLRHGQVLREEDALVARRDGAVVPVSCTWSPIVSDGRLTGAVLTLHDIRERKRGEEASRQLAAIVESSDDAIVGITPDGIVISWNSGAERLYGYSRHDVVGHSAATVLPPELQDGFQVLLERLRQGEHIEQFETVRLRSDGRRIDVSVSMSPIKDAAGSVIAASAIERDIGERKRAQAATEALRRSASLAAIGTMAGSIVHELSQPVTALTAMLEMLVLDERFSQHGRQLVKRMERALKRMGETTGRLRRFARQLGGDVGQINVHRILEDALSLVEHDLRLSDIQVVRRNQADLPAIHGYADELEHLFVNLLTNARDAMAGRAGHLTISTQVVAAEDGTRHVVVRIEDQGAGMPEQVRARIFEPLFTTKSPGKGTGLGLSLCRQIVERHGGSITLDSVEGEGSCFSVWLPVNGPESPGDRRPARNLS